MIIAIKDCTSHNGGRNLDPDITTYTEQILLDETQKPSCLREHYYTRKCLVEEYCCLYHNSNELKISLVF